jgi:hypothetical protein
MNPQYPNISAVLQATPKAVIPGVGGRNQHYWFHQQFLDEKDWLQLVSRYAILKQHREKRRVQLALIAWVEDQGGVFYRQNKDGTYQPMTFEEKLHKCSIVLREKRKGLPDFYMPLIDKVPDHLDSEDDLDDSSSVGTFPAMIESEQDMNDPHR